MKKVLFLIVLSAILKFSDAQTLIKNIAPGALSSVGYGFYNFDNTRTIFFGKDGSGSYLNWLYITDGTSAGTLTLANLNTPGENDGYNQGNLQGFTKIDSLGFILGRDISNNTIPPIPVLIRTNGTISGTTSHYFAYPSQISTLKCTRFFKISNKICWIYYSASYSNARYLFSYDLFTNTINYKTLPQPFNKILFHQKNYNSGKSDIINNVLSNNNGFFCYNSGYNTSLDSIFNVDLNGNFNLVATCPQQFMPYYKGYGVLLGNKFLFRPNSNPTSANTTGNEPYSFDISSYSFGILKDVNPYFSYSSDPLFIPLPLYTQGYSHQYIYFTAKHTDYGREIWITDGTTVGTHLVKDLKFGPTDGWVDDTYGVNDGVNTSGEFFYIGDSIMRPRETGDSIRFIKPTDIITYNNLFPNFIQGQHYLSYCWSRNSKLYFIDNMGIVYAPPYAYAADTLNKYSCGSISMFDGNDLIESNGCLILTHSDCVLYGYEPYIYCNNDLYTVGLSEIKQQKKLTIFPNPAEETLYIQLDNNAINYINVLDIYGRLLIKTKGINQIDISSLVSGNYFLQIYSRESKTPLYAKFIKL